MTALVLAGLLTWGVVVALDLVSGPQALLARPVVAGTVAGLIAGDLEAGLRVGMLLEMFALDVLPVGASRYPDYGPATVAAVAVVAGLPWQERLGLAMLLALPLAFVGGLAMQWLRHANARAMQDRVAAVAAADRRAIAALHYGGLLRDGLRGAALTGLGLAVAVPLRGLALPPHVATLLLAGAVGSGLAAVMNGALRSTGRGTRARWLVAGLGLGGVLAVASGAWR
ncbi:MAG TPA: PTS sugar transporter subunit IIC [Gemmatimonadales bacterium]|nr:PTS sugar transporter subunit IIC [Gemmatimonadales bacterium]